MVPPNLIDGDRLAGGTYGSVDAVTVGGVMVARKTFLGGGFNTELTVYQTLQANNGICPYLIRMLVYHFVIYMLFSKHF